MLATNCIRCSPVRTQLSVHGTPLNVLLQKHGSSTLTSMQGCVVHGFESLVSNASHLPPLSAFAPSQACLPTVALSYFKDKKQPVASSILWLPQCSHASTCAGLELLLLSASLPLLPTLCLTCRPPHPAHSAGHAAPRLQ